MGKSAGSAPQAPDPNVTIPLQGQENRNTFDYVTNASRVNEYSPTGSVTWNKTPAFDEAGYNAALAAYQKKVADSTAMGPSRAGKTWVPEIITNPETGAQENIGGRWVSSQETNAFGAAPTKDQFTTYDWSKQTSLSPEQQKLYDANTSSQLTQSQLLQALTERLGGTIGQPIDYSGVQDWANPVSAAQLSTNRAQGPQFQTLDPSQTNLQNSAANADLQQIDQGTINRGALPGALNTGSAIQAPGTTAQQGGVAAGQMIQTPGGVIQDRSGGLTSQLEQFSQALGGLDPNSFNQEAADAVYGQSTRYLDVQTQQEKQALESRLAEQGFVPGTPGYQRAMQNFMDTNNRAYADARDRATMQGTSVGRDAFGSKMSAIQSQIAAALQGAGFGLTNDQARSTEGLNLANFASGQQSRNFNERLAGEQFGANRDDALFSQLMGQAGFNSQEQQNQFGRDRSAADLAAGIQQQDFAQQSQLADRTRQGGLDANNIAQQLFQNQLSSTGFNNQVAQQGFNNRGTAAGFNNSAAQQAYTNTNSNLDAQNATLAQQQQLNQQAANGQNSTRAGQIAELLQQRQMPLNELNALRSGTQVQMPTGSGQASTPGMNPVDVMGAYNNQYQGQIDAYNAQVGSDNSLMSMLGGLGGAALGSDKLMAALLAMSDMRLKENAEFVGKTPGGNNVYEYDIFGRREQGVFAQELQEKQPEAVVRDPDSGFLMVDYAKVK